MSGASVLRYVLIAFSVVVAQSTLFDGSNKLPFGQLDLPLAVLAALIVARPASGVVLGMIFGLAVDAFHLKHFGLHCLVYVLLGPIVSLLPTTSMRSQYQVVISFIAIQVAAGTGMLALAAWWAGGSAPTGALAGDVLLRALWAVVIGLPIVAGLRRSSGYVPSESDYATISHPVAQW